MKPLILRHGEALSPDDGIDSSQEDAVTGGSTMARVERLPSDGSMLHFESYSSTRWPRYG